MTEHHLPTVTAERLLDSLALSPSRAGDYQQCPLLYRFRAIDKLPEPATVAQVKGMLVHQCLEDMHGWEKEKREFSAVVNLIKPTWVAMCDQDPSLNDLVPPADQSEFFNECWSLLRGYFHMENPQGFDAHACELPINTQLGNGVPVRGFIDRVDIAPDGAVRVVDYKTGKKPAPRFSAQAHFQMRFYALVWWRLHGVIPRQLRLMYLKVADDMVLQPSQTELEYFEKDLAELWVKIVRDVRSGQFRTKRSKLCGWCAHQQLCPEFGGTPPRYPGE